MVRIELSIDLHYDVDGYGADFIFNFQAARTASQHLLDERLGVFPAMPTASHTDALTQARFLRLAAPPGHLHLGYRASLELVHFLAAPELLAEVPVACLPPEVLPYLYPSRYCPSDRLGRLVMAEFGGLPRGYGRVMAIQEWVQRQVRFQGNSSNSNTWALDTLIDRVGVCRDFAHLMIALCRALSIPARFVTGIDYGADPALGPTDFHACVEVFLDQRWYLFDPSGTAIPMGFIRIGTGRDAADVSFATIFGNVTSQAPIISIRALEDQAAGWELPYRRSEALSTDSGSGFVVA
ncbi:MAG: transglutaminase family protein [Azovibrio sp.]|uniref:transglutaminase-like domain-containing protein n=1 Tax=Azovibrio sp. TaxID=1872673 RepID=UPI003C72BC84